MFFFHFPPPRQWFLLVLSSSLFLLTLSLSLSLSPQTFLRCLSFCQILRIRIETCFNLVWVEREKLGTEISCKYKSSSSIIFLPRREEKREGDEQVTLMFCEVAWLWFCSDQGKNLPSFKLSVQLCPGLGEVLLKRTGRYDKERQNFEQASQAGHVTSLFFSGSD